MEGDAELDAREGVLSELGGGSTMVAVAVVSVMVEVVEDELVVAAPITPIMTRTDGVPVYQLINVLLNRDDMTV